MSQAQNFMQGVGINVGLLSSSGFSADPVSAINYSPRVSFMETETSSLSLGISMSFGISGCYNSQNLTSNSLGFMYDAPLMFDCNYGARSSKEVEDKFGFFAGVGFGYHSNQNIVSDEYGNDYSTNMSG